MKSDAGLRGLLQIADDLARMVDGIRDSTDEDSPGGKRLTLAELAGIAGTVARLSAHVAMMIAGGGRR